MGLSHVRAAVVLAGRPNVGKSVLFNRLVGKASSLVDPRAGCTRDVRSAYGRLVDLRFRLFDTPGLEWLPERVLRGRLPAANSLPNRQAAFGDSGPNLMQQFAHSLEYSVAYESLYARVIQLTERFLRTLSSRAKDRTLALFLVDASQGVVAADHQIASLLRRLALPTVLVLNKCDMRAADSGTVASFAELGFPSSVPISALQGEGFSDLYHAMQPLVDHMNSDETVEACRANAHMCDIPRKRDAECAANTHPVQPEREFACGHAASTLSHDGTTSHAGLVWNTNGAALIASQDTRLAPSAQRLALESSPSSIDETTTCAADARSVHQASPHDPQGTLPARYLTSTDTAPVSGDPMMDEIDSPAVAANSHQIRLTIVGRPNVGKSTLANALLGYERFLTAPFPGVTRDAVTVASSRYGGFLVTDTAGARRRTAVAGSRAADAAPDPLETGAYAQMLTSIATATACGLVLDAAEIALALQQSKDPRRLLTSMEHSLIQEATELQGKPLLLVLNKTDLLENKEQQRNVERAIRTRLQSSAPEARHAPIIGLSAACLSEDDAGSLFCTVRELVHLWSGSWSRGELSQWLFQATRRYSPPVHAKFAYMIQTGRRPPVFTIFGVAEHYLSPVYRRTLLNALKLDFGLQKVPVKLCFRSH